jgi:hypothetical protein
VNILEFSFSARYTRLTWNFTPEAREAFTVLCGSTSTLFGFRPRSTFIQNIFVITLAEKTFLTLLAS